MADISKCCNTKCPSREECYRYRVKPNEYRQSYCEYNFNETGKCLSFQSIEGWNEFSLIPIGAVVNNFFVKEPK